MLFGELLILYFLIPQEIFVFLSFYVKDILTIQQQKCHIYSLVFLQGTDKTKPSMRILYRIYYATEFDISSSLFLLLFLLKTLLELKD